MRFLLPHFLFATLSIRTARCTILPLILQVLGSEGKHQPPTLQASNSLISVEQTANQPLPVAGNTININGNSDWVAQDNQELLYQQVPQPVRTVKYVSSYLPLLKDTVNVPQGVYYVKPGGQRVPGRNYVIRFQNPTASMAATAPAPAPAEQAPPEHDSPLTLSMGHPSVR